MNSTINELPSYQLLLYVAFGAILLVGFYIISNYIIPLLRDKQHIARKYWQKFQIISWLLFAGLFFIALFRTNMIITLSVSAMVISVGWSFWMNLFSGIIIKYTDQFRVGETISTDFAKGELRSINWAQSELINEHGELVTIPNHKLRSSVLKHLNKKSDIQLHSFKCNPAKVNSIEEMYQIALNCPFISANQKIEVDRGEENGFIISASVIDKALIDNVRVYFQQNSKD